MAHISEADDLAARLSAALAACNLSRSQLPMMLGVHKSMVSRWLSGEMRPNDYNLARLSAAIASLKPGFNMTLWTAPMAEFEAALGLQSMGAPEPVTTTPDRPHPLSRSRVPFRRSYAAIGFTAALALIAVGIILWRGGVTRDLQTAGVASTNIPQSANHAEAVRLTQAASALIHERNRQSVAEAEHLLREAVAADPSYAPAWARLGQAAWFPWWWTEQREPGAKPRLKAEALAYIRRALAISPDLAEAQGIMGMVLTDTNEGLPWLQRAVQRDAGSPELWMWLGDARIGKYDLRGALDAYEKARALDPAWHRSDGSYLNIVFRLRGAAEAHRELDRMSQSMNDQDWARQQRADIEFAEGRLAESAASAIELLRTHPLGPYWARNRLVFIAALLGDKALQDRMLEKDDFLRANFNALQTHGWAAERARTAPDTWWDGTIIGAQAAQLVTEGKAALLVSLYDRRFRSPEDFVLKCSSTCNAISAGPALAIALRRAGRPAEGDHVLAGVSKAVGQLEASGDRLFNTELSGARLASLSGNATEAIRRLRDAVERGWKGQDTGFPDPAIDPAFESLHNDTRFQAVVKLLRVSQKAEAERLARLDISGI